MQTDAGVSLINFKGGEWPSPLPIAYKHSHHNWLSSRTTRLEFRPFSQWAAHRDYSVTTRINWPKSAAKMHLLDQLPE